MFFVVVVFLRNLFRTVYSYNNFSSSLPFEEVQSTFEEEIFDNYLIPFISADVSNGNIFYENKLSNFPGRTFADSLCPGPMSQGTEFSNFFLHALSFLNDEESSFTISNIILFIRENKTIITCYVSLFFVRVGTRTFLKKS